MEIIKGNILDVTKGVIAHQANARGVMGAGLALALRKKYPQVYTDYHDRFTERGLQLGDMVLTRVTDDLSVASLIGQADYGREEKVYTSYQGLGNALSMLSWSVPPGVPIYMPYGMGCGLAGGDWNTVFGLINKSIPEAIVVKL